MFLRKRRCLHSWGSLGQPRIWRIGSPDFKGAPDAETHTNAHQGALPRVWAGVGTRDLGHTLPGACPVI